MIVIEKGTTGDVMEEMGAMGEVGEADVGEVVQVENGVAVGAVLTVEAGTVVALREAAAGAGPSGLVVESQGQEISRNFQTLRQTRGQTHIPLEWEFRGIAGEWNPWSHQIHALRIGCKGRLEECEGAKEGVRAGLGKVIGLRDR